MAQWSALGRIDGASQTLYGLRMQRAGRGLTLGFDGIAQGGGFPTLGTPFIQWIGDVNGLGINPGDLEFRFATSPTNASPITMFIMSPRNGVGCCTSINCVVA